MFLKKQEEFNNAMQKYHQNKFYQHVYTFVSVVNIGLEVILLYILFTLNISWFWMLPVFLIAYFSTDFLNGFVHLYMDNNDNYNSFAGVFIARFHLHHKTPTYKNKNVFVIYFNESGSKFWLVPYLIVVLFLSTLDINHIFLTVLILVGILSSFAEVSHYLCHNSKSKIVLFLQKIGLLLSMNHHERHHMEDNNRYAFLNGMSDFILDKIAKIFYGGYKDNLDKHYEMYREEDTSNRSS
ncbi:fatty acid desaturase CarF family protein [Sulfurimonas sp.]|uniref:fatty acid desaturase CarF family protein n=1 Tax=Sulfurimonas sp. TaxID=2022749 RepID=UPI002B48B7AC|nr:fatty acid desaturase CarF family protein [Sulfurimonas sp.]